MILFQTLSRKFLNRFVSPILIGACLMTNVAAQNSSENPLRNPGEVFRVGTMISSISSVSIKDVEIGTKLIVDEVMREIGADVTMNVYSDLSKFHSDMSAGLLDLVIGSPQSVLPFLKMDEKPRFYTFEADGKSTHQFVLISRTSSGIDSLADLSGKDIVMFRGSDAGKLYLNSRLKSDGLPKLNKYVRSLTHVRGHADAINRVFFGQADAGFVTKRALNLAMELNPQIKNELQPLLESPELLTLMIIPLEKNEAYDEFEPVLFSLHESPKGRTLMNVFQCDRVTVGELDDLILISDLLDHVRSESMPNNPVSVLKK